MTFAYFKPWKLSKPASCQGNCYTKIKNLLWIANQPFWASQCACCSTYQFERGQTSAEWGGIYG